MTEQGAERRAVRCLRCAPGAVTSGGVRRRPLSVTANCRGAGLFVPVKQTPGRAAPPCALARRRVASSRCRRAGWSSPPVAAVGPTCDTSRPAERRQRTSVAAAARVVCLCWWPAGVEWPGGPTGR